ncbi:MAG: ribosomal protein S18-alanine N-acetyltransferase [Oscillospiraceae bacterium]|nr:ribosomal protein S18-alanine N-acetyltransferase [Oscillospiraceae bacterium]
MIRRMTIEDVPQIAALEKVCFSDPWSQRSIASELSNPYSCWLVWEEEGTVLGYIGSQTVPPEADVMNVAVAPEHRKKKIGSKLLTALCELLHREAIDKLFLEVRASNTPAIALYEGFGFQILGRRPKYYVNPVEDAYIMGKELSQC